MHSLRRAAAISLALMLLTGSALAGGTWRTLTGDAAAPEAPAEASVFTGTVTMTFLGDCTLGGESKNRSTPTGFFRRIEENGYGYPMRNLKRLTLTDDLTVANLEGVLTDRKLQKRQKTYNFSGPTAYTQILTEGGIECVTLANNHSHDYGDAGYADTKAALEGAQVAWFGTDAPAFWESDDGLRIGFLGVNYALYEGQAAVYRRQLQALRDAGCAAVVTVMHAGEEYTQTIHARQRQIAQIAADAGVDLVVGHHPHVVQGFDLVDGMPVVYSLGNCAFGGARHVKDADALALRAELRFTAGALETVTLRFYPITVTTDEHYNDFSPAFLTGEDAQRVLDKMLKSTGFDIGVFDPEKGAVVECPARHPDNVTLSPETPTTTSEGEQQP